MEATRVTAGELLEDSDNNHMNPFKNNQIRKIPAQLWIMLNVKHFSTAFKTNILEYILVNYNLYTGIIVYACVLLAFFVNPS